jgi:hypothetical protein
MREDDFERLGIYFDPEAPKQRECIKKMMSVFDWDIVASEMDNYLRNILKYDDNIDEKTLEKVQEIRDFFNELLQEYGLDRY